MTIRPMAVAGSFYPRDKQQLQNALQQLLDESSGSQLTSLDHAQLKALIVPHAGFIYSGVVAASAYRLLLGIRHRIRRVVLLGPSHRVHLRGIALPSHEFFNTPLGTIALDKEGIDLLSQHPSVQIVDAAHADEHSLEVQLPFLQTVLNSFTLLPMVVGATEADTVCELLKLVWDDDETIIVISSDLSHFHNYSDACEIDHQTSELIEAKNWHLQGEQTCGAYPLNGLLKLAAEKSQTVATLDLRNSGDTAGSKDRVVGYGAYAVYH